MFERLSLGEKLGDVADFDFEFVSPLTALEVKHRSERARERKDTDVRRKEEEERREIREVRFREARKS